MMPVRGEVELPQPRAAHVALALGDEGDALPMDEGELPADELDIRPLPLEAFEREAV